MKNVRRTKARLLEELDELRHRMAEAAAREEAYRQDAQELQTTEEWFRDLYQQVPLPYQSLDEDGRFITVNQAWLDKLGYSRDEVIGRWFGDFLSPQYVDRFKDAYSHFKAEGIVDDIEFEMVRKDGSPTLVSYHGRVAYDDEGKFERSHCIFNDITERRRLEDDLRRREAEYRSLVETAGAGIVSIDRNGAVTYANDAIRTMVGFSRDELIGRPFTDFLHPDDVARIWHAFRDSVDRQEYYPTLEFRLLHVEGHSLWCHSSNNVVALDDRLFGLNSVIHDITYRKQAEDALRDSEEFASSLLASSPFPMLVINPDSSVRYVNPALERITGLTTAEVIGVRAPYPWWTEETLEKTHADLMDAMARGAYNLKEVFRKKNGERIHVEITSAPVTRGGQLRYYLATWVDVTERKRAEDAVRESEAKYRSLVQHYADGVMIVQNDEVKLVNPAMVRLLAADSEEAIAGKPFTEFVSPEHHEMVQERGHRRERGEDVTSRYEIKVLRCNGTRFDAELSVGLIPYEGGVARQGLVRDITERKQAEERIRDFQKRLRSLASQLSLAEERERKRLAAGLHDEISQPLGILKMRLGELGRSEPSADIKERLGYMEALVDQMIADTRSLMFDMSPPVLYELGLEAGLEWLCEQIQAEHGITCVFEDDGQPKPLGDDARGLLFWDARELLVNVVKHARATTATVSIRRDGDEARITVEDDGKGFDTKRVEKRTRGFGLFSIRERLTEFGGRMELHSSRGKGTRVTLVVPLEHHPDSAGK